jgi:hypothetical protein
MTIRHRHFPELGVTINVFQGALTLDEMLAFVGRLDRVAWRRSINYLDPSLDLSGVKVPDFPVIKRALADKLTEIHGETHLHYALVSAAPAHEFFLHFWPEYVGREVRYPVEVEAVPTLKAACERLGLPGETYEALSQAVSAP